MTNYKLSVFVICICFTILYVEWIIVQLQISLYCEGTEWLVAGSPSLSGAVIRRHWLQLYIQFISLLVAYSS